MFLYYISCVDEGSGEMSKHSDISDKHGVTRESCIIDSACDTLARVVVDKRPTMTLQYM